MNEALKTIGDALTNASNVMHPSSSARPSVEKAFAALDSLAVQPALSATLYEHDDGRQFVALDPAAAQALTHGKPEWHRVRPMEVVVSLAVQEPEPVAWQWRYSGDLGGAWYDLPRKMLAWAASDANLEVRALCAAPAVQPAPALVPDVDQLANHIRRIDGQNQLAAGVLAEAIMSWFAPYLAAPQPDVATVQAKAEDGAIGPAAFGQMRAELMDARSRLAHGELSQQAMSNRIDALRHVLRAGAEALREYTDTCEALDAMELELSALPAVQAGADRRDAIDDVLAERRRQVEKKGWTPEHDDGHEFGELASASACYALAATGLKARRYWPWHSDGWIKQATPRRNLVKAGALILAEIERLDRAAINDATRDAAISKEAKTNG